jgi:hypothetical protein
MESSKLEMTQISIRRYAFDMLARDSSHLDIDPAEAADAEAMADYKAGRFISHESMRAWILSWGTDNELPCPEIGD